MGIHAHLKKIFRQYTSIGFKLYFYQCESVTDKWTETPIDQQTEKRRSYFDAEIGLFRWQNKTLTSGVLKNTRFKLQ